MKFRYLIFCCIVLVSATLNAQEKKPDWRKLHYLSEEEMYMDLDHKRSFTETDPPEGPVRNVAEFDQMQSVLIRYPLSIPVTLVKELADDIEVLTIVANAAEEQAATSLYVSNGVDIDNCSFMYAPTNSQWTRDYGPWFIFDADNQPGIVDFIYNRPRPLDNNIPSQVANYLDIDLYGMNLVQTGGNYMTDGLGKSSSTELVVEENPSLSKQEIDSIMNLYLNIEDYYVLNDPLDDYIKHIDCWGKFLSPGKVLIGEVPESDDRYEDFEAVADFFKATVSSWGKPYEVFRVYTPGNSLVTPYTNSLIANEKVFVPLTGGPWDDEALEAYEEAMPGYEVVGITYNQWFNTDALHCRTKGIADLGMLYIEHMPILGTVGQQDEYEITAEITACSGENIYSDSVLVYYSINGGNFQSNTMTLESGSTWKGTITGVGAGDEIDYYLYAADESGRRIKHPYIGEPDPHEFTIFGIQNNEIAFFPDTLLFLHPEQAEEGLPLQIINMENDSLQILDITEEANESSEFFWYVDDLPELPVWIEAKDTLTIHIMVDLPRSTVGEMLTDQFTVTTAKDSYDAYISIDNGLITNLKEITDQRLINVFPNPFNDHLVFSIVLDEAKKLDLRIFDLTGKEVFQQSTQLNSGGHSLTWDVPEGLPSGYYIYRIRHGEQVESGKVILNR